MNPNNRTAGSGHHTRTTSVSTGSMSGFIVENVQSSHASGPAVLSSGASSCAHLGFSGQHNRDDFMERSNNNYNNAHSHSRHILQRPPLATNKAASPPPAPKTPWGLNELGREGQNDDDDDDDDQDDGARKIQQQHDAQTRMMVMNNNHLHHNVIVPRRHSHMNSINSILVGDSASNRGPLIRNNFRRGGGGGGISLLPHSHSPNNHINSNEGDCEEEISGTPRNLTSAETGAGTECDPSSGAEYDGDNDNNDDDDDDQDGAVEIIMQQQCYDYEQQQRYRQRQQAAQPHHPFGVPSTDELCPDERVPFQARANNARNNHHHHAHYPHHNQHHPRQLLIVDEGEDARNSANVNDAGNRESQQQQQQPHRHAIHHHHQNHHHQEQPQTFFPFAPAPSRSGEMSGSLGNNSSTLEVVVDTRRRLDGGFAKDSTAVKDTATTRFFDSCSLASTPAIRNRAVTGAHNRQHQWIGRGGNNNNNNNKPKNNPFYFVSTTGQSYNANPVLLQVVHNHNTNVDTSHGHHHRRPSPQPQQQQPRIESSQQVVPSYNNNNNNLNIPFQTSAPPSNAPSNMVSRNHTPAYAPQQDRHRLPNRGSIGMNVRSSQTHGNKAPNTHASFTSGFSDHHHHLRHNNNHNNLVSDDAAEDDYDDDDDDDEFENRNNNHYHDKISTHRRRVGSEAKEGRNDDTAVDLASSQSSVDNSIGLMVSRKYFKSVKKQDLGDHNKDDEDE